MSRLDAKGSGFVNLPAIDPRPHHDGVGDLLGRMLERVPIEHDEVGGVGGPQRIGGADQPVAAACQPHVGAVQIAERVLTVDQRQVEERDRQLVHLRVAHP